MGFEDAVIESQTLVDRYRRGELKRDVYLERLRYLDHGLHASVRTQAVGLLGDLPEPERTRELMQLFHDCQWRETQIAVLRRVATRATQRGLEFLVHVAANDTDLGLCREAIAALGQSRSPLAARYLVTQYQTGPAALKPYITLVEFADIEAIRHDVGELFTTLGEVFLST